MNDIDDPRRLFESDDAPAELRGLLQRAYADTTSDAAADQLVRAVERRVRMQAPASGDGTRVSWAARHATRLFLAAALVGVGAGVAYWAGNSNGTGARPVPTPGAVLSEQPRQPVTPSALQAMTATNTEEAPIAPRPPAVANVPAPPHPHTSGPVRAGRTISSLPETDTAVFGGGSVGATSADEYRLLRAARQSLSDRPARALELTDEHAHRFANGMLTQEREAIAVEALVKLGREGSARTRAQAFFVSYPSSPYRHRVERALDHPAGAPQQP
jgi:hypothetical protein